MEQAAIWCSKAADRTVPFLSVYFSRLCKVHFTKLCIVRVLQIERCLEEEKRHASEQQKKEEKSKPSVHTIKSEQDFCVCG